MDRGHAVLRRFAAILAIGPARRGARTRHRIRLLIGKFVM